MRFLAVMCVLSSIVAALVVTGVVPANSVWLVTLLLLIVSLLRVIRPAK